MSVNKVVYNGNTLVDLTGDSVTADKMLSGTTAHDKAGNPVTGNVPNNGAISKTIDGISVKSAVIPQGYTSGGTVSLTDDIDNAVADAVAALTEKGVTVPDGTKVDGLAALIAAIEAGVGAYEVYTGDFTVAEDTKLTSTQGASLSFIDTGRTDNPYLYGYWLYGSYPGTYAFNAMIAVLGNESNYYKVASSHYTTSSSKYSGFGATYAQTSTAISTQAIVGSTSATLYAGATYKWIALYAGG